MVGETRTSQIHLKKTQKNIVKNWTEGPTSITRREKGWKRGKKKKKKRKEEASEINPIRRKKIKSPSKKKKKKNEGERRDWQAIRTRIAQSNFGIRSEPR